MKSLDDQQMAKQYFYYHVFFSGHPKLSKSGTSTLFERMATNCFQDVGNPDFRIIQKKTDSTNIILKYQQINARDGQIHSSMSINEYFVKVFILCIEAASIIENMISPADINYYINAHYVFLAHLNCKLIVAINKCDLVTPLALQELKKRMESIIEKREIKRMSSYILCSAKTGYGCDNLEYKILFYCIQNNIKNIIKTIEDSITILGMKNIVGYVKDVFIENYFVGRFLDLLQQNDKTQTIKKEELHSFKQIKEVISDTSNGTYKILQKIEEELYQFDDPYLIPLSYLMIWDTVPRNEFIIIAWLQHLPDEIGNLILKYASLTLEYDDIISKIIRILKLSFDSEVKLPRTAQILATSLSKAVFSSLKTFHSLGLDEKTESFRKNS